MADNELQIVEATGDIISWEGAAKRALEAHKEREQIVKGILVEGVDYGLSPGTPKKVLWQAGAQKICDAFACYPKYSLQRVIEDFDAPRFHYVYLCELIHRASGIVVSSAIGSCNSMERKYALKKDGTQQPIHYTHSIVNTIDKMAQKRAHVGATMNFGFSQYFTQDLEGIKPEKEPIEQPKPTHGEEASADPGENGKPPIVRTISGPQAGRAWAIAHAAAKKAGLDANKMVEALLDEYQITSLSDLAWANYDEFIGKLEATEEKK